MDAVPDAVHDSAVSLIGCGMRVLTTDVLPQLERDRHAADALIRRSGRPVLRIGLRLANQSDSPVVIEGKWEKSARSLRVANAADLCQLLRPRHSVGGFSRCA